MATQASKPCTAPGCCALAQAGKSRCVKHMAKAQEQERERSAGKRMYLDTRYRKARAVFMAENPMCVVCGALATDLDHIVPHKGDMALFWDTSNWQAMCVRCHSTKTATEDGGFGHAQRWR